MLRGLFIVSLMLFTASAAAQSIEVAATVNQTTVGRDDLLVYNIQVKGASISSVSTPNPPATEGLALVQRVPSTHRNMSIINGRLEESVGFRWTYRPLREGNARIEAAEVVVDGRSYTTRPIAITVVSSSQSPPSRQQGRRQQWPFVMPNQPPSDDPPAIADRDLFIRAIPSKREVQQNEQVTVEYQLYFRDGIQLRHSRLIGSWDAEGFWREEFEVDTRPIPKSVVENGLLYHLIVLKRVAVFPTREGRMTIDPLRIETEAYFPSSTADAFERFFSLRNRFETVELASEAVRISVRPLPSGEPPTFSGAVGDFEMEAAVDKMAVEVGEPVQVRITVRGTGNIATLDSPTFSPPGVFEQYDPEVRADIKRTGERISGVKEFTYILVPRSNGEFALPPVVFTYFRPSDNRYATIRRDLGSIRVTGTAAPLAAGTTADGLPVDDIASILTSAEGWRDADPRPLHKTPWPYAALVLPLGVILALQVRRRHVIRLAGDVGFARNRMAHPLSRKHLKRAEQLLRHNEPRAFYEEIERAVLGFIGNRLNVAELGLTRSQVDQRMVELGVSEELRSTLRTLLEECDQARFAPVLPDRAAMESARERAAGVIVGVDEAVQSRTTATA